MKIEAELYQTDLVVPEIYWEDGIIPVETEENGGHAYYFQEEKNRRREEEEEDRLKSLKELQTEFENQAELAETQKNDITETIQNNSFSTSLVDGILEESINAEDEEMLLMLAIIEVTS